MLSSFNINSTSCCHVMLAYNYFFIDFILMTSQKVPIFLICWRASYPRNARVRYALDHWIAAGTMGIIAHPFTNIEVQSRRTLHFARSASLTHIITGAVAVRQHHWLGWIECRTASIRHTVQWTGVAVIVKLFQWYWRNRSRIQFQACSQCNHSEKDELFHLNLWPRRMISRVLTDLKYLKQYELHV